MRHTLTPFLLIALGLCPTLRAESSVNPLLLESPLPFHYPRFDLIKDEHYAPAFTQGMAEQLKEIGAIAADSAKPTIENTIVAMEKSGATLGRARAIFGNVTQANTNTALDAINDEFSPKFAAHRDAIYLNTALFARVKAIYAARATLGLDAESVRLIAR